MAKSKIEWTEMTWNPVVGCTKVSAGCQNCYAERMTKRFWKKWGCLAPPHHFGVTWHIDRLDHPLHWRKPRRIFVCSMGDLFHEAVSFEFIDKVMAVIALCPQHTFLCLTKRIENTAEYFSGKWGGRVTQIASKMVYKDKLVKPSKVTSGCYWKFDFPLKNLWLGVSVENQKTADERLSYLFDIPATHYFVSYEPALEYVDFTKVDVSAWETTTIYNALTGEIVKDSDREMVGTKHKERLSWLIVGCESGANRRPCKLEWVRSVVEQCKAAGVPVFVKQIPMWYCNGEYYESEEDVRKNRFNWLSKTKQVVVHDINRFPKDLQIREYPQS